MKVLMFGWEFPPHISGGLGTACFGLSSGLLEQGIDVLFVVPKLYGDEDTGKFRFVNASEVEMDFTTNYYSELMKRMEYIQISSSVVPYMSPEIFSQKHEVLERDVLSGTDVVKTHFDFSGEYGKDLMKEVGQYAVVAAEIARTNQFDVIHAHDWLTYPAGIAAKQVSGKPLVVHMHATEFDRSGDNVNQDVYDLERQGLHAADAIVAVSGLTKRLLVEKYGVPAEKITVVHNAVLPVAKKVVRRKVQDNKKEKIITFLGRVTFQKGPEYFVEASAKVLKKFPDVRFVMAGSGDMLPKIIKLVAKRRIGSHFHFTGFLEGAERDHILSMSDVFVMPSVSEPFGIAPLEAIRSGVPVIISRQSGVAEVVENAIKVDFWDVDAIADAIAGILSYKPLSKTFIREGGKEVEKMQWAKAANSVNKIYNSLIK